VSEQLTVSAGEATIDAEESATGTTIAPRSVQDLPIRRHNYTDLI